MYILEWILKVYMTLKTVVMAVTLNKKYEELFSKTL